MISPKASLCRSIPSIFLCLRFTSIVYLAAAPNLNSAFDESISVETQGWARFLIFGNRSIPVSFRASCSLTSSSAARPFYTSSGFSKSLHSGLGLILIRTGSTPCTGFSDTAASTVPTLSYGGSWLHGAIRLFTIPGLSQAYLTKPTS